MKMHSISSLCTYKMQYFSFKPLKGTFMIVIKVNIRVFEKCLNSRDILKCFKKNYYLSLSMIKGKLIYCLFCIVCSMKITCRHIRYEM